MSVTNSWDQHAASEGAVLDGGTELKNARRRSIEHQSLRLPSRKQEGCRNRSRARLWEGEGMTQHAQRCRNCGGAPGSGSADQDWWATHECREECGSEPPAPDGEDGRVWGDCWCTLPADHEDDECVCTPCRDRFGAPGWPKPVGG